jgi:6-phosphogluconolactonase
MNCSREMAASGGHFSEHVMARNNSNLLVLPDIEAVAANAAERLIARLAQESDRAAVCLTGGSAPEPLYRLLATEAYRSRLPWERVHWFVGDERFVPEHDALSNMGMARRLFLDLVGASPENIHPVPTTAESPEAAARRYEAELKRFYGGEKLVPGRPLFAFVLMGFGNDGHTASLFPNAPALQERERWAVGVDKAGLAPFVPRITLTFPVFSSSREMLFLVTGSGKRDILARVLAGEDLPAGRARSDGELIRLVDRAAAGQAHDAT